MPLFGGRTNMIAPIIYLLCALTSFFCAWMLFRSYLRQRYRLLLLSSLCFSFIFLNNLFLVCDKIIFPNIDFKTYRLSFGVIALLFLLYGLVWEDDLL